ncbi:MAG: CAP domain-containing protein, partial [Actinomycetota bacterium]
MAKRFVMFLAAVVLSLAMPVLMAGPAFALSSEEQGFVSGVNVERAKKGVPALAVADDLVTVARAHSAEMAAQGTIFHNPNLANAVTGWQVVGENVGMGPTVSSINSAFIASPKHYENFVDSVYTQIGVGVVIDAKGTIFVTQVFRQPLAARVVQAAPAPVAAKP